MKKTVVITGGAGGIGSAAARLFHKNNYNVLINYNHSAAAAELLLKELGENAAIYKADVSESSGADALIKYAYSRFGGIDVLINNAGISEQKLFTDITDNDWEKMIKTNLSSAFYCCRSVVPVMLIKKSGAIINISSIWGIVGASCEVHYSVSKAGLLGLTKGLAKELAPSGIRVNAVAPGIIDTKMMSSFDNEDRKNLESEIPLGRFGNPDEIADAVFFLAENTYTTGQVLSPNGGFTIY